MDDEILIFKHFLQKQTLWVIRGTSGYERHSAYEERSSASSEAMRVTSEQSLSKKVCLASQKGRSAQSF